MYSWTAVSYDLDIYDIGLSPVQFFSEDIIETWKAEKKWCFVLPSTQRLAGLLERASDHSRLGDHHSSGQSRGFFIVKLKLEDV